MIRSTLIATLLLGVLALSMAPMARANGEGPAASDTLTPEKVYILDPTIVTATRTRQRLFGVPRAVTVVEKREIELKSEVSVLDNLHDHPGVWVEKRTVTTSDPVMRGLSGFNILALIDGNTLSTLWGEGGTAGDDMYGKVDAASVEQIEVVRGPSSVLYGSNALAGVFNFITKSPPLDFTDGGTRFGARTRLTYGSASEVGDARTEVYGATPRFRFLLGGSLRDIGDAKAGGSIGRQIPTSGKDKNFDLKTEFLAAPYHTLQFSMQNIDRDDVHRFYRPGQTNYNDRVGASLKYRGDGIISPSDRLDVTLYYQYKKDTRVILDRSDTLWALTKTYAADVQWTNPFGDQQLLTGGVHFELDDGEDPDDEQFTHKTAEGVITKDAPDSEWKNYAGYLQDQWSVTPRLRVILGARWDLFDFKSDPDQFYDPPGGVDPSVDRISETNNTFTGGVEVGYRVVETVNLYGSVSRGFRQYAPVFGITQHAIGIQVPSGLLDPASSLNYEAGFKVQSPKLRGSATAYYSDLNDFPIAVRSTYEGQDWYDYNGSGERDPDENVFVTVNAAKGYVYGVEAEGEYLFHPSWRIGAGFAYSYGEDETNNELLRHTIPAWGVVKLRWHHPKEDLVLEFSTEAAASFDRIPSELIETDPGYRTDPQDMTSPLIGPDGTVPSWMVFNLRGSYTLNDYIAFNAGVENLTDEAYRRVHSRWDELGRNFVLGITLTLQ